MKSIYSILGIYACLQLFSCQSETKEVELKTEYAVTNPLQTDTVLNKEYVCQINAISHIELRALESGYLQNIFIDEGQFVKKGQRLFQILPSLYQAETQKAQAEVNFAEIEYQNTKRLSENNVVSKNELALAKAKLDKAKAELQLASVHLGFTEIKAPFDGIVDRFHVRLGSLLEEGELISNLSDNHAMWVYFNVPEAEYLDYMTTRHIDDKMKVQLIMANNKPFDYQGIVETIEADFNNETGNIAFRATFINPKGLLRHGETGNILVKVPYKNAIIIPQKATFEVLDKKYVFVVDKHNVIHTREIKIGAEIPNLYVISKGLKKTDKILLEGINKVRDGEKIKARNIHVRKVISGLDLYAE